MGMGMGSSRLRGLVAAGAVVAAFCFWGLDWDFEGAAGRLARGGDFTWVSGDEDCELSP